MSVEQFYRFQFFTIASAVLKKLSYPLGVDFQFFTIASYHAGIYPSQFVCLDFQFFTIASLLSSILAVNIPVNSFQFFTIAS